MQAYKNNPALKNCFLAMLSTLRDEIVQRPRSKQGPLTYTCVFCPGMALLGCRKQEHFLHADFENATGIPAVLSCISCFMFAFLKTEPEKQYEWARKYFSVIPVGADLSSVWTRLVQWMLLDKEHGAVNHVRTPQQEGLIRKVAEFYQLDKWHNKEEADLLAFSVKIAVREVYEACSKSRWLDADFHALDIAQSALEVTTLNRIESAGFCVLHFPRIAEAVVTSGEVQEFPGVNQCQKKAYDTAFQLISDKIIDLLQNP